MDFGDPLTFPLVPPDVAYDQIPAKLMAFPSASAALFAN